MRPALLRPALLIDPPLDEDLTKLHEKCGLHVQIIFYIHSIVSVFIDLIAILVGIVFLTHPEVHRESPVYGQFFQQFDRSRAYQYYIVYNCVVISWVCLYFFHTATVGIAIFGVQRRKPVLIFPHLFLILLRIGILLAILCALITLSFVGDQVIIVSTIVVLLFLAASTSYLVASILCFRFVHERYTIAQRILASTKSVHFKEHKKRPKKRQSSVYG